MKEKIKKFGLPWICLFIVYFIFFIVVSVTVIRHLINTTEEITLTTYITPVFGLASLFVAMVTIRYNAVTNKEKNALDFVKEFKEKEIHDAMVEIYKTKRKYKNKTNNRLNRKDISPYCERAAAISNDDVKLIIPAEKKIVLTEEIEMLTEEMKHVSSPGTKSKIRGKISSIQKKLQISNELEEICKFRSALVKVLNLMERCANGVRYGLYDEGLIYNSYGTQFIEIYELAFSFIKRRQDDEDKLFINAEWLAVKWTLQKEIQEDKPTFMTNQKRAIQHANEGLKSHMKAPDKSKLEPLLSTLQKLKFPR